MRRRHVSLLHVNEAWPSPSHGRTLVILFAIVLGTVAKKDPRCRFGALAADRSPLEGSPAWRCAASLNSAGFGAGFRRSTLELQRAGLIEEEVAPWILRAECAAPFRDRVGGVIAAEYLSLALPALSDWPPWIPARACLPQACIGLFGDAALPRLLELLFDPRPRHTMPPAGPCFSEHARTSDGEACSAHIVHVAHPRCAVGNAYFRLLSNEAFFRNNFGARTRAATTFEDESHELAYVAAQKSFRQCRAGGGVFFEVSYSLDDVDTPFRHGACMPEGVDEIATAWWVRRAIAHRLPGMRVRPGNVTFEEQHNASELRLQWVVVGVAKAGTTSLASWLRAQPRLHLADYEGMSEGAGCYAFMRMFLNYFVPHWAFEQLMADRPVDRDKHVGIKEVNLLFTDKNRWLLAEMPETRIIVIVKDWLDWVKSVAFFLPPLLDATDPDVEGCVRGLAMSANRSRRWSVPNLAVEDAAYPEQVHCRVPWHWFMVVRQVADLRARGVPLQRIKVVDLATLRSSDEARSRLVSWVGAGVDAATIAEEQSFHHINRKPETKVRREFFASMCRLPDDLAARLDAQRRRSIAGLAWLIRRTGGPVPRISPVPVRDAACARAGLLARRMSEPP